MKLATLVLATALLSSTVFAQDTKAKKSMPHDYFTTLQGRFNSAVTQFKTAKAALETEVSKTEGLTFKKDGGLVIQRHMDACEAADGHLNWAWSQLFDLQRELENFVFDYRYDAPEAQLVAGHNSTTQLQELSLQRVAAHDRWSQLRLKLDRLAHEN